MNSTDWVVVGRFGRPHGVKGYITVNSFTEPRENILQYTNWHIHQDNIWLPLTLRDSLVNIKHVLVKVENYCEREEVAALTNREIAIHSKQLPELAAGEYYWHQLLGMQVVTTSGHVLGEVKEILATGAHDVLVIQGSRRHLVPYVLGKFVISINDDSHQIIVEWDEDY